MKSTHDLIAKAGGEEIVASACNVTTDAIRKWREAGVVPSRHWLRMAELCKVPILTVAGAKLPRRRTAARAA